MCVYTYPIWVCIFTYVKPFWNPSGTNWPKGGCEFMKTNKQNTLPITYYHNLLPAKITITLSRGSRTKNIYQYLLEILVVYR